MDDTTTRLRELARLFTRLGFTAFGGPAAHVALMEQEIVDRRQWIDRQHFLDLIAAVNFIPGPNSTELAIHIGQLRAGFPGLVVAGTCFITPAALIVTIIAWAYVRFGSLPQVAGAFHCIAAAVVAVILWAIWRFAKTALKDGLTIAIAILTVVGHLAAIHHQELQPELLALVVAAILGAIWYRSRSLEMTRLMSIAIPIGFWPDLARLALVLLKIGGTLFGSGYVLLSYLQADMVDRRGWLTTQQLNDAIAVGQITPGPLLTTSSFVGYLVAHTKFNGGVPGGIIGAAVATIAIFLPAFILVTLTGSTLQKLRTNSLARGALDGMNAAVVGLMILPTLRLAVPAVYRASVHAIDYLNIIILLVCIVALGKKMNATWLILAAGLIGIGTNALQR